jgi:hypothetical protein
MRRSIALIGAVCISQLLHTGLSYSQTETQMVMGSELLRWCADGTTAGGAACTAYILGISEAFAHPDAVSCPQSATRERRREVVVRFLTERHGDLELPAALLVQSALQRAFPCRSQPRK